MIQLREILSNIYVDKSYHELYKKLEQYHLSDPLQRTITQLNNLISNQKQVITAMKTLPAGHIASNLLHIANVCIAKEQDTSKKAELENFLSDVCMNILKKFFEDINLNVTPIYNQLFYALRDTCEFHNYDFNQLLVFLKLDSNLSYYQTLRNAEHYKHLEKPPFYYWKGKIKDKSTFLSVFTEQKLIKSKKGLAALFDSPTRELCLKFDPIKADLLLQLFYNLKKKGLLSSPKGWGFYQVLAYHTPDFEELFLNNKLPKYRINGLRESRQRWANNQLRIEKWLTSFEKIKTGLRAGHSI
jgi:hypothetical protein